MTKNNGQIIYLKELSNITDKELIKELKNQEVLKYSIKNKKYYLNYVGLIGLSNGQILSILPKCIPNKVLTNEKECLKYTKSIISAIEKYNEKNLNNFFCFDNNVEDLNYFNYFALYDSLILDYLEYGLYTQTKDIHEKNGDNEIDWDHTLNIELGYLGKNKKPLYLDYHNLTSINDDSNFIQEIHKFLLNQASFYFQQIPFFTESKPRLDFYTKLEIGKENIDKAIFSITKRLRLTFNQRKIRLLKLMLLILEKQKHSQENGINLYGIKDFHRIWEDICKVLFNNLYTNDSKYKEVMKNLTTPKYTFNKKIQGSPNTSSLIPDVVTVYEKDNEKYFFVIDAKYYNISIQSSEVDDEITNDIEINDNEDSQLEVLQGFLPGTYDILKQLIYMETFLKEKEKLNIDDTKIKNIFIIPGKENKYIGKVEMGIIQNKCVELWLMDIKQALNFYLKNKSDINLLNTILFNNFKY